MDLDQPPPTSAHVPAAPGPGFPRVFGAYVLLREVGSGGMGRVYEARHARRDRVEALKVLRSQFGAHARTARRFEREVKSIARVSHDHIVSLYDSGMVGGELYYTMPLLPGPSLEELVDRIRATMESPPASAALALLDAAGLPPALRIQADPALAYVERVCAALVGVADALVALHQAGVIHRDVKPSNLLLGPRGRVLLADFGLAHTADQKITETGQLLGTPAYMSPEQVLESGRDLDGRVDVYALGATLFELLTLHRPHEGANMAETMALILKKRARLPSQLNPSVPAPLDAIVSRCLERSRADRYASAAALRDDLRRFVSGEAVEARPLPRRVRGARFVRRHILVLGLALTGFATTGAWYWTRPGRLDVHTTPVAEVWIDDLRAGSSPLLGYELPPGAHEVRAVRPDYAPYVRTVRMERGAGYGLDVMLQALNPASPAARAIAANAFGLQRSGETVSLKRDTGPELYLGPSWPRGALREPPTQVVLAAVGLVEGIAELWRLPSEGGEPERLYRWPDVEALDETLELPIPPRIRDDLRAGPRYEVRVQGSDFEPSAGRFRLLSPQRSAAAGAWLRAARSRFQEGDLAGEFVAAEYLLANELFAEALEVVDGLVDSLGERKEVARLALEVLDRAGVRSCDERRLWSRRFVTWPD